MFFKKKSIIIILSILTFLIILWTIFNVIPPKKIIESNPFIHNDEDGTMLSAHQGGNQLNPGNTFKAFDYAISNFDIDILELDLCLTKDEKIVAIHDDYINDSSDVEEVIGSSEKYFVKDHTYEELLNFNFGAKFKDLNGNYPYQNLVNVNQIDRKEIIIANKLNIVTMEEIFDAYFQSDLKFIVEIKDRGDLGKRASDLLYSLMTNAFKYPNGNLLNKVVVGTFNDDISFYLKTTYPDLLRGGSRGEVSNFIKSQMLGLNIFINSSFHCLQIPITEKLGSIPISLDLRTYINRAHRLNMAVQYWTINDEKTMRDLINKNVDAIMTDRPDLLFNVLKELGYR